ncbi:MAG: type II secretion system major pseudopilin GspG [Aliidiomarina sp.]|uniref:type II secretion system major pseudopilin GspG n=1 Tax=Aliidiomarina sp. TaxID=1872439 RepID=UPI0025C50561|nr:type II secretion system major pseudopilin GspG [Aliidiomarina sp.]MCH8502467.1 type II secretion system major pseudopilin GspG [Aliidiomarina sp.]
MQGISKVQRSQRQFRLMKRHAVRGFTLVELLIVIVIVGLLASIIGPQMFGKVDSSQVRTAEAQMRMLQTSINTFRLDVGDFPQNLQELRQSDRRGWDGPYFPQEIPLDPWGNSYVYERPGPDGKPYILKSLGRNGQPGGEGIDAEIVLN